MRQRIALLVAPLLLLAMLPGAVSAAPHRDAKAEHRAAVIAYWTPARMKAAKPLDITFDAVRGFHAEKGKPGGGGGGGGTPPPTNVTGASWTAGGKMLTTTGRVLFHLGSGDYVCSGSVVDDGETSDNHAIVLTAGHCVTGNTPNTFATQWMYIPSFDTAPVLFDCARNTYGCWVADALYASTAFATAGGFNTTAIRNDWGFARVSTGGFDNSQVDAKLGTFPIQFSSVASGSIQSSFGYPAAAPYNGSDLIYCRGPISYDFRAANATYGMTCNATGGASGGPWVQASNTTTYADAKLISVNSYRYNGGNAMYGPKFNSATQAVFGAADAGGTPPSGVSWRDLP